MDSKELKKTHPLYNTHLSEWGYNQKAYDGGKAFIEETLERQARESEDNWKARQAAGVCFNYARVIVDIYSFYLTEQHPVRDLKELSDDILFSQFEADCDMRGTDFEVFLTECQKLASVSGAIGILVDKPLIKNQTREQAIKNQVYPYCSAYTLPNVLDWEFKKNKETGRPELAYLKLKEADGSLKIWTPTRWEQWEISTDTKTKKETSTRVARGNNPLGIIPFLWMQNIKSITRPLIGLSDITEISRLTASIIRDISCGDEIIKYAGFPMLRKPMRRAGDTSEDISGITAILEFDPEAGKDGKPDWLEAPTKEPIDAVLSWINKKSAEAFKQAHLSGVHAQETSSSIRSGVAMRYEFQQLSRVLVAKSINMNEAELKIIHLFMKWQDFTTSSAIAVTRPNDFSVDDLSVTLENLDIARHVVKSLTYQKELQKVIVRKTVSDTTSTILTSMYDEIDTNTVLLPEATSTPSFTLRDQIRQDTGFAREGIGQPD